jgi:hypothetical protein
MLASVKKSTIVSSDEKQKDDSTPVPATNIRNSFDADEQRSNLIE